MKKNQAQEGVAVSDNFKHEFDKDVIINNVATGIFGIEIFLHPEQQADTVRPQSSEEAFSRLLRHLQNIHRDIPFLSSGELPIREQLQRNLVELKNYLAAPSHIPSDINTENMQKISLLINALRETPTLN